VLGLTSYQEALRALGRILDQPAIVSIIEHAEGFVEITTTAGSRQIQAAELEDIVRASLAQRGEGRAAGEASDVLRALGQALDQLRALDVRVDLRPWGLRVRFSDTRSAPHELTYAGDELQALRDAAVARRHGQPLSRVLVLEAGPDSAAEIVEVLLAEFAVQSLPTRYARAIAQSSGPPDLVLTQMSDGLPDVLRALRSGRCTAEVPIVVLASQDHAEVAPDLFAAGADDVLLEPFQAAQLRARLRTWLLRGRASP
jgi:CheY-like chemotaxis protein